jgi:hypothetical protein
MEMLGKDFLKVSGQQEGKERGVMRRVSGIVASFHFVGASCSNKCRPRGYVS